MILLGGYAMIAENVKKVFEENPWFLATCGEEPNVVPVGFKCITEDGKFAVGAVLRPEQAGASALRCPGWLL